MKFELYATLTSDSDYVGIQIKLIYLYENLQQASKRIIN